MWLSEYKIAIIENEASHDGEFGLYFRVQNSRLVG